jgi:hypothetical protein
LIHIDTRVVHPCGPQWSAATRRDSAEIEKCRSLEEFTMTRSRVPDLKG